jgi:hypothetical protein
MTPKGRQVSHTSPRHAPLPHDDINLAFAACNEEARFSQGSTVMCCKNHTVLLPAACYYCPGAVCYYLPHANAMKRNEFSFERERIMNADRIHLLSSPDAADIARSANLFSVSIAADRKRGSKSQLNCVEFRFTRSRCTWPPRPVQ